MEIFRRLDASGKLRAYGPPLTAMTTSFTTRLADAASFATCKLLSDAGSAATAFAVFNAYRPKAAVVSAAAGWVANFASRMGCEWNPNGQSTLPPGRQILVPGSCMETVGCDLLLRDVQGRQWNGSRVKKLFDVQDAGTTSNGTPIFSYRYVNCDGETVGPFTSQYSDRVPITTTVDEGGQCVGDPAPAPPPSIPEYEYQDPESDCTLIVETLGFAESSPGVIDPVFQIKPGSDLRENGGGIIGGCNFSPVIYYQPGGTGGGGGDCPPTYPPVPAPDDPPPDVDGVPWWLDLVNDTIGSLIGSTVADALASFFEEPYGGVTYRVVSVCEKNENGEPISKDVAVTIPTEPYQSAVLKRIDAVAELLQPLKDFKQPTCSAPKPQGDFRTISFISDERSPFGNDYLRKRLRYRSQSGTDLAGLVDHWKDFTWDAGPVCVQHSGHSWGTPQVWAASIDEGKRVLQHAGGEAGIDPNQVGQWTISGSDNPRFGVSGRMRVNTKGGYYWITERLGSNGRPVVATT